MSSLLLKKMSSILLIPKQRLDYLIRSAPYRYKVFQIKKRSGSGTRTIAQPAKEIKKLQYWVIENIFSELTVHKSATAYVKKINILNNASVHSSRPYILKTDFENFFPSINGEDLIKYFTDIKYTTYQDDDLQRLTRILFWKPEKTSNLILSIGAPSSPFLSNLIMYKFDCEIFKFCNENDILYTRYADDIVFSMYKKEMRRVVLEKLQFILDTLDYPTLKLNNKKTIFGSKSHRRIVTGLILTNDGNVSLGRDKKRNISARIHHLINGNLSIKEKDELMGLIAFAQNVEPVFIERMKIKYGQLFTVEL